MISQPIAIIVFLLFVEILILYISSHKRFQRYFKFLPSVFWIYFLPMLASTAGFIDSKSPVFSLITTNLLPACLMLLLIPIDIKAIVRLGGPALLMFFAGSAGIILGAPLVFFFFKHWVGQEFWAGYGALSASWTGGSANMIAVKEAIGTPDAVFLPMVIVDTIVPYVWMGILIALAGLQFFYDRWNGSNRRVLDKLGQKREDIAVAKGAGLRVGTTILILLLAFLGSAVAQFAAKYFPIIKDMISTYAWTIILVSVAGILLSLTRARRLENFGVSRIGYFILYFVLTAIGARANFGNIQSTGLLIASGFLLVLFHAVFLVLVARLIRAPMFLVAVASQANIGGVASAPIVAEVYQSGLASVGLLLAILGNIVGTYFGILAGQLCRMIARI